MVNVLLRSAGRDMKTEVVPQVFFFSFSFSFLFYPFPKREKIPSSISRATLLCVWQLVLGRGSLQKDGVAL